MSAKTIVQYVTLCAVAAVLLGAWTSPAGVGFPIELATSDRCDLCGDGLIRSVNICLSSSAMPMTCVQQAIGIYSNCTRRESDGCAGTRGRQLSDCAETCSTEACVRVCLDGV